MPPWPPYQGFALHPLGALSGPKTPRPIILHPPFLIPGYGPVITYQCLSSTRLPLVTHVPVSNAVCLFVFFHPTVTFFNHLKTSPLPVKDYKFWPMPLSKESSLACHTYCDTGLMKLNLHTANQTEKFNFNNLLSCKCLKLAIYRHCFIRSAWEEIKCINFHLVVSKRNNSSDNCFLKHSMHTGNTTKCFQMLV